VVIAHKLCKSYDGDTFAVDRVSLFVQRGALAVLLGESGSGKTTLLKMVNRLIEPTSGTIELNGRNVREMDPVKLRRSIGYAFQRIGLFPNMTVAENVGVTPGLLGWEKQRIEERVEELLELVHLSPQEYRDRMPHQLSGGEQQRVGFARALASGPSLMLLDEPFGALDPVTRDRLQAEFVDIHRKLGLTTMMVTHDVSEALLMADRILVMRAGRILQEGTPGELLSDSRDGYVAQLMATPQRQIDRYNTLMEESPSRGPLGHE